MEREKPNVIDVDFEVVNPPKAPPKRRYRLGFNWTNFLILTALALIALARELRVLERLPH